MRYAMTGATGFLGLELARQLHNDGHQLSTLVRDPGRAGNLRDLGATLVPGDLDDAAALDRLLHGADGFFHVAGWYKHGRREHERLRRANVDGTVNALAAARRAGVRTVYTSTIALNSDTHGEVADEEHRFDGQHLSEYDRTKHQAHEVAVGLARAGLPLVIVQPSVIYGPGADTSTLAAISRKVVRGRLSLAPKGAGCGWAHVADVAHGHVLAMEQGRVGESYILAGPNATYEEAFSLLARMSDGRRPILVPRTALRAAALLNGLLERLVPLPAEQTREGMLSGAATYYGTSAKAERELGWHARPLEDGFADLVSRRRAPDPGE